jgi:hypothetical protein
MSLVPTALLLVMAFSLAVIVYFVAREVGRQIR